LNSTRDRRAKAMEEYRLDRRRVKHELEQASKEIETALSRVVFIMREFEKYEKNDYAMFLQSVAEGIFYLNEELKDFVARFI